MSVTTSEPSGAIAGWKSCEAVEKDSDKVSGAWVFRGTRVPVAALFENLRDGASIQEFLSWFPGVEESQAVAVLEAEMAATGFRSS